MQSAEPVPVVEAVSAMLKPAQAPMPPAVSARAAPTMAPEAAVVMIAETMAAKMSQMTAVEAPKATAAETAEMPAVEMPEATAAETPEATPPVVKSVTEGDMKPGRARVGWRCRRGRSALAVGRTQRLRGRPGTGEAGERGESDISDCLAHGGGNKCIQPQL